MLSFRWEGFGWQIGTIVAVNEDGRCSIDKVKVNFFVRYDMDPSSEPPVPHVLTQERYQTSPDAPYESWLLLKEDGPEAEAGEADNSVEGGGAASADAEMDEM